MAERKAVNKYYPPDWDPSKGSINQYVGQHPLRERARKLGQGILVIRFEMPYNIWCGGCNSHIGMGVRYNAEKSKTGNYYSTPIYKFRMKCHLCDNYFEIQTDPKNHDYVILNGARRKEQRWDPKENEQIVPEDKATQKKLATDAMYKLEHGSDDHQRGRSVHHNLHHIEESREDWKEDYLLNKALREKFREEKKAIKASESSDRSLLDKSSLDIKLLDEEDQDRKMAGLIKYSVTESYDEKQKQKRKAIESRPIFESSNKMLKANTSPNMPKASRSAEITKKLGISPLGGSKNPFDSPSIVKSSKALALGIRKKSVETPETFPSSNNGSTISPVILYSDTESASSESSCPESEQTSADTAEENVISLPNCKNMEQHTSIPKDSECDNKMSAGTAQNALGALISNYSDSEEES
ncbi:coiled-coil domain-containing protein 130 homolog [Haliotis rufescens]|uniref:coiled-coil domain-containing protein 130 homolog n=1 Tax=Haliotis rufescens TaxID=6454 RepID=UPI00201F8FC0|nr:coiled-coil domain-containing protein 130 homolog [Haliotis rufescens]